MKVLKDEPMEVKKELVQEEPKKATKGKRIEFVDRFGSTCLVRKSTLMKEGDGLEIGVEKLSEMLNPEGPQTMHLPKDVVQDLIPHLQAFVEVGDIDLNQEEGSDEVTPTG